jgi:hypothetical protein
VNEQVVARLVEEAATHYHNNGKLHDSVHETLCRHQREYPKEVSQSNFRALYHRICAILSRRGRESQAAERRRTHMHHASALF